MIRQVDENEFYLCYDADGSYFKGPFSSREAANEHAEKMCKFDQMVMAGRGPYLRTDVEFLKSHCNGNQFERIPYQGDAYKESCEKHGGSVTGKVYLHQLARFPGDPKAWVSGRGDVERVARERGMHVEGLVDVKVEEPEPPKPVDIAPDILDREVKKALHGTRGMPKKLKSELREAIRDKIAPKRKAI